LKIAQQVVEPGGPEGVSHVLRHALVFAEADPDCMPLAFEARGHRRGGTRRVVAH